MPSSCTLTYIRSMSRPKPLLKGLRTSCIKSDPETTEVKHQRLKLSHTSCPLVPSALCAHPHLSNSTPSLSLLHDLASSSVPTSVLTSSSHWLPISPSLPLSHAPDSHPHAPYFHPYTLIHPFPFPMLLFSMFPTLIPAPLTQSLIPELLLT